MQRFAHVVIPGCLAGIAAAEWLHGGGPGWAWVGGAAGLAAALLFLARKPRDRAAGLAALAAVGLGAVLVTGALELRQIECCWPALRERLVTRASEQLATTLAASVTEARRLAERGGVAALLPQREAFDRLEGALGRGMGIPRVERGIIVLAGDGEPWAWAGRHRFVPAVDTAELRAVITPFYVSLEARRQTQGGGTAVGTVLLDAPPSAPDRDGALSAVFAREHGAGLRFFPPRLAPAGPDVFDYTTPQGDTLFSVQAVPPTQGDAQLTTLTRLAGFAAAALAATVLLLLVAAPPGRWRWTVALAGAWCLTRAPLTPATKLAAFFSPATFYRPLLGVFTSSAGSLTVLAALMLFAAGVLWRRGLTRYWWSPVGAGLLVLAAPFLVRNLGRGITPPARGVSIALWLSWEAALAVTSMALILLAAALVRGSAEPRRVPWALPAACGWALLAAVAGLWLWEPNGAWPDWYTYVWLPALAGVLVPAPRRWAVVAIATVAGTAAALVTWGASVEGRLALAERDARSLGGESDPLAAALLERMGARATLLAAPHTAVDLYGLWLRSPLATADYPTVLSVWTPAGEPRAELPLASLDLPPSLIAALVRSPATRGGPRVERVAAVPGLHYVLVAPVQGGAVLAVGVGPRSRLVPSSRLARFLHGDLSAAPPYTVSLSLPSPTAATPQVVWVRAGWTARGERRVALPGGVRHVHLRVDLQGPWPLLVRGALVVVVDVALLAGCWLLGVVLAEGWRPNLPPMLSALRSSYRLRLTAALAGFFGLPVLAFALWSFARFSNEVRDDSDLLIRQTLKDAAGAAGAMSFERPAAVRAALVELGTQLDADLWLYRDGVLAGTSTPVLDELGLIDPYLAVPAFERLALEDELELAADGATAGRPIRIGYRVVVAGPPRTQAILAAPQLLDDEGVRQQQENLALTLLSAAGAGLIAAIYLAGLAARGLARPVAALREAAVAVGRGAPLPPFAPGAPREFEPVMTAFERMATDVRTSQAALEDARRRTAQVLANVATGVIAVDGGLRITLANARAAELVGGALERGTDVRGAGAGDWTAVWDAVAEFLTRRSGDIVEREFAIAGRQIRVQIAPLGPPPEPAGCVVALDDATALTRAARVLAWGEMARQVAHEIKNPLTPIRLGIQHLQRARRTAGFDATLRDTAARILAEINRLDAIARAFSRFGSPAEEALPLEPVDLYAVAREVVQLYSLAGVAGAARFELAGDAGPPVVARRDEVKEVLVNLLENARNAGARRVVVRVAAGGREVAVEDDGRGIPAEALPRVFDPAFSTTSSGLGLGLAIAKRLVDSWGGTITLTSTLGSGTTLTITLVAASRRPQGDPAH